MRLVHARYQPDSLVNVQQIYDESIIPRLQKTEGCLSVSALKSEVHPGEGISMTLWTSRDHAEAYEKSGVFQELFDKVKPFLVDSSEWKVQLSEDLTLEYQPVSEEPVVKTYATTAQTEGEATTHEKTRLMFLRILSVSIQPGKIDAFRRIYTDEVIPVLRNLKGCRFAFLTESVEEENKVLCITIWESKEDADAYEKSGRYDELIGKLQHTFSELYQWKMALDRESAGKVMTSEDLHVDSYSIVVGKRFK
jgi:quinol monooxygenase YgiN